MPLIRIDGTFKSFRFKNYKGPIYSLSINCDEEKEEFFERLCEVVANEACRLIPNLNGKKLKPESFELVKNNKNEKNVYAKIYTKPSGPAKCKASLLVENKGSPIQLEELIDESFEGSCIL